jgi:hypothetical protein
MTIKRRKILTSIRERIEQLIGEVEEQRDAEADAFDALSDSGQESEKGQAMDTAREALESVVDDLNNAVSNIDTATEENP